MIDMIDRDDGFKFPSDFSARRSGEEGSRDRSVFQSPSSSHLDLHFVLTAGFFEKGEYKEGKFYWQPGISTR